MRTLDGKCDDMSCHCRTELGYCALTACIKTSTVTGQVPLGTTVYVNPDTIPWEYTTTHSPNAISPNTMNIITDSVIKEYLRVYLKHHTVSDLIKVLAEVI